MAFLGLFIRYVVNSGNEEKNLKNEAFIFFCFSLFLIIIAFVSLLYLYKSKYGTYHLSKTNEIEIENSDKKELLKKLKI